MTTGLLLMAYGTPEREEDLLAYYTDIRRGRPPTDEQLADLRRRYDAIGGLSPLAAMTRRQRDGLQEALGGDWIVELGLKHAEPKIEEGAEHLAAHDVDLVVGLVLAPHASALSTGQYHERAAEVLTAAGVEYRPVGRWGHDPRLVALLAERTRAAVDAFAHGTRVELLVTAHSLPQRVLGMDDPSYPDQLQETADLVAAEAGLVSHRIAWQSAGRTPEPWLGPDILDVLRGLPAEGFDAAVVCPAGFTADHLEVLFDVDIEARQIATDAGLGLARTDSMNDHPAFIALLADLARTAAGAGSEKDR